MQNLKQDRLKCTSLVVKVASRCNINCSYCYMYNLGDQTYKNQPKIMSHEVVNATIIKTKENCIKNNIKTFVFAFHGGEPMLGGMDFYRHFVKLANEQLLPEVQPIYAIQTNGIMLTDEWCRLFAKLNIEVGISMDGLPEDHDKYRLDHQGKGTHSKVVKGLEAAQNCLDLKKKPGILSVINYDADPIKTFLHFCVLNVQSIDFLFPYNNYETLSDDLKKTYLKNETPYGDWLISVFNTWYQQKDRPDIRMFSGIINAIFGGIYPSDLLGDHESELLVIETDGGIEAVDYLKSCGHAFTKAGANVLTNDFEEAMDTDLAKLYHFGHTKLCTKCLSCPVKEVCGGGNLASRYSKERGFNNVSIYCTDLLKLITHIQCTILSEFPIDILTKLHVSPISYEEALVIIHDEEITTIAPNYISELESF
ncbi:radical SAM protein [Pedobacter cryoconitis]|uniref:Radical SAM core domain-containing protein n=1 Tax=Pedobacter cryoconitis TaxID=188932 RepID=A0A327SDV2_9SPHI|nr:radical SAM protein [Pedobacter cryoconitis]RAJ27220.1 uncharacterized protein LY11_03510 [Pedobacter cryoconitis]